MLTKCSSTVSPSKYKWRIHLSQIKIHCSISNLKFLFFSLTDWKRICEQVCLKFFDVFFSLWARVKSHVDVHLFCSWKSNFLYISVFKAFFSDERSEGLNKTYASSCSPYKNNTEVFSFPLISLSYSHFISPPIPLSLPLSVWCVCLRRWQRGLWENTNSHALSCPRFSRLI